MNSTEQRLVEYFFHVGQQRDVDFSGKVDKDAVENIWGHIEPAVQKFGFEIFYDWCTALQMWMSSTFRRTDNVLKSINNPELYHMLLRGSDLQLPQMLYRGMIVQINDLPSSDTSLAYGAEHSQLSGWTPSKKIAENFIDEPRHYERGIVLFFNPASISNFTGKIVWAPPPRDSVLYRLKSFLEFREEQEWVLDLSEPVPVSCKGCSTSPAKASLDKEPRPAHVFEEATTPTKMKVPPALDKLIAMRFGGMKTPQSYNLVAKALLATKKPVAHINEFLDALEEWFEGGQMIESVERALLEYRDLYRSFGFKLNPPKKLYRGLRVDPTILPDKNVEKFYYGSKYKSLSGWTEKAHIAQAAAKGTLVEGFENESPVLLTVIPSQISEFSKRVIWAPPPKGSLFDFLRGQAKVFIEDEREWILDCSDSLPVAKCEGCVVKSPPKEVKDYIRALSELRRVYKDEVDISGEVQQFLNGHRKGLGDDVSVWTDWLSWYRMDPSSEHLKLAKKAIKSLLKLSNEFEEKIEGSKMNEQKNIIIDLGLGRKQQLNEFTLTAMGSWITFMLQKMFGWPNMPNFTIKGSQTEIEKFGHAVNGEKRYMDSFKKFGLDNPKTLQDKYKLEKAVKEFERETNLVWPFK